MTSKKKAVITILLSFLVGGVAGILVNQTLLRETFRPSRSQSRYEQFKARMQQELELNVVQQQQFEDLMKRRQAAFDEFRQSIQAKYREMRQQTRDSIRALLTPAQLTKFEALEKEFDTSHRREGKK